jgi:hypothetical protein
VDKAIRIHGLTGPVAHETCSASDVRLQTALMLVKFSVTFSAAA